MGMADAILQSDGDWHKKIPKDPELAKLVLQMMTSAQMLDAYTGVVYDAVEIAQIRKGLAWLRRCANGEET
jgi:hypothetical protein